MKSKNWKPRLPGIFLISLLSNATLILPVPGVLFTSAMVRCSTPSGWPSQRNRAAIGEISGYWPVSAVRGSSNAPMERPGGGLDAEIRQHHRPSVGFHSKPPVRYRGVTAGMLKMPLLRFLFW